MDAIIELNKVLEATMRKLDPVLVAGKESDMYEDVVKKAQISSSLDLNEFKRKMTSALEDVYGKGWLLNEGVTAEGLVAVLYSSIGSYRAQRKPHLLHPGDVWYDGDICEFASWKTSHIIKGKTYYVRKGDRQKLQFVAEAKEKEGAIEIHMGGDLSIVINPYGRLLYPAHHFDNLFLEEQHHHSSIELPETFSQGVAYITSPSVAILKECRYFNLRTLSVLKVDKEKKLLQFGDKYGSNNIEIASGFILSFEGGKLVNAWLKIENVS